MSLTSTAPMPATRHVAIEKEDVLTALAAKHGMTVEEWTRQADAAEAREAETRALAHGMRQIPRYRTGAAA